MFNVHEINISINTNTALCILSCISGRVQWHITRYQAFHWTRESNTNQNLSLGYNTINNFINRGLDLIIINNSFVAMTRTLQLNYITYILMVDIFVI